MTDALEQRKNMVESQVRPSDVTDRRITRAMTSIPRERFVPTGLKQLAYMDDGVAVEDQAGGRRARTMMAPRTFAKLIQLANIEPYDVVLDIGCTTGYSSAVLSSLCETVVALESDTGLADTATELLSDLQIDNVVVVTGSLAAGYASEGPYDSIVLQGAVPETPLAVLDQLKDGGRLAVIETAGEIPRAVVWRRLGETFDRREVFEATAGELPGFEYSKAFVL